MPKRTLIFLFILLSLCFSCLRNSALDSVESYIQERPDSALAVLRNLPSSAIKNKRNKARYALLYSIALDKNYIDISSDSTISEAVVWFEKTRDRHRLMQSYYYAGKVEYNAGNYAKAISYGQRALDLAEQTSEKFYSGLICWLIGDIYFSNHNYFKAKSFYDKADISFLEAGKGRYSLFSKCESAKMDIAMGEYHNCDSLLCVIHKQFDSTDVALASTYYSLIIRSSSLQGKDNDAISAFYCWNSLPLKTDPLTVYGQISTSFARAGDDKSAGETIKMAYASASDDQLPVVSSYMAGLLYINKQYKQAIDSLTKGYNYQNDIAVIQFANSIDEALSEYYKSETRIKEQRMNGIIVLIIIIAIILVLSVLVYNYFRKKEYQAKLNAAKADIAFTSQMNKESLQNFSKYLQIRQNVLDDVIAGYNTEKHSKEPGIVYDIVDDKIESLKAGGDGFKKLVKDLNLCFHGIVRRLKEDFPDLSKQDYHILVYYFSGFSQETVSTLTRIPVEKLYNLKRSWIQRFNQISSPDRELFLGRMNTSKYLLDTNDTF